MKNRAYLLSFDKSMPTGMFLMPLNASSKRMNTGIIHLGKIDPYMYGLFLAELVYSTDDVFHYLCQNHTSPAVLWEKTSLGNIHCDALMLFQDDCSLSLLQRLFLNLLIYRDKNRTLYFVYFDVLLLSLISRLKNKHNALLMEELYFTLCPSRVEY